MDTGPQADANAAAPTEEEDDGENDDRYRVKLDVFEGPLDLLLHLIRKHELDILDIPVGFVTTKYLEYLNVMKDLKIDVASEYLVMAATLAYIKSKMLLPPDPNAEGDDEEAEDESDPRAELVRRLLEYQKYRHAADQIAHRATVGRDMFGRGDSEAVPEGPAPLAPVSMYKLFDAFERVLKRANQSADHQVLFERVSITDRIVQLTELLAERKRMRFEELFGDVEEEDGGLRTPTRLEMVITFLALLEMGKMRMIRIVQDDSLGPIVVEFATEQIETHPQEAPNPGPAKVRPPGHPESTAPPASGRLPESPWTTEGANGAQAAPPAPPTDAAPWVPADGDPSDTNPADTPAGATEDGTAAGPVAVADAEAAPYAPDGAGSVAGITPEAAPEAASEAQAEPMAPEAAAEAQTEPMAPAEAASEAQAEPMAQAEAASEAQADTRSPADAEAAAWTRDETSPAGTPTSRRAGLGTPNEASIPGDAPAPDAKESAPREAPAFGNVGVATGVGESFAEEAGPPDGGREGAERDGGEEDG